MCVLQSLKTSFVIKLNGPFYFRCCERIWGKSYSVCILLNLIWYWLKRVILFQMLCNKRIRGKSYRVCILLKVLLTKTVHSVSDVWDGGRQRRGRGPRQPRHFERGPAAFVRPDPKPLRKI